MVISDSHPVPPLFLGKVRSAVPEVVAIIGNGGSSLPPVDEPQGVDDAAPVPPVPPALTQPVSRTDAASGVSPSPPDAGGDQAPRKRRRW
jgi:hypothetical protein